MRKRLPLLAVLLGLAGLIPLAACALATVSLQPQNAAAMLSATIGYGALSLAFLGGVHWGLALEDVPLTNGVPPAGTDDTLEHPVPASPSSQKIERNRLLLGVLPCLIGWAALLLMQQGFADFALGLVLFGFTAVLAAEVSAARKGAIPGHYMALRWILSLIAIGILTCLLVLRLIGATIIL